MNENIMEHKKSVIEEISSKIENAESVVVFEYQGLSVTEFETLRNQLREENVDIKVYKNRLAKIAVEKSGHEAMSNELVGPNAIAFSNEDAVAGARIIAKFAKDHEAIKMKTGIVEGNVVDVDVLNELASLPSRDGLLSMLLSCLQAPARDMAMIVDAVATKVEETGVETAKEIIVEKTEEDTQAEAAE